MWSEYDDKHEIEEHKQKHTVLVCSGPCFVPIYSPQPKHFARRRTSARFGRPVS
jgi:hypothetical protein